MACFNKGPAYGLSAEVKNKVRSLRLFNFINHIKLYQTSSSHFAFFVQESPGLHFEARAQFHKLVRS